MAAKKHVKTNEVLVDIRSGMSDEELREKYKLTAKGLASLIQRLLEKGAISLSDLVGGAAPSEDQEYFCPTSAEFRARERCEIDFPLLIHDADNPDIAGVVRDISDDGVRISGVETEVCEVRIFSLRADEYFEVEPILFEAECRWTTKEGTQQIPLAGFAVTNLMEGSLKDLIDIMAALSLEERCAFKKRF